LNLPNQIRKSRRTVTNIYCPYQPDFSRLRTTLFDGKADRVPLMELGIDEGLMSRFIDRPLRGLQDKIDFFRLAGYDYIKLSPVIQMNPGQIAPKDGFRESQETSLDRARVWGTEGKGAITNFAEFERFVWPEVRDEQFALFAEAERILPAEMKVIGQYGDIFTFAWEFMGFEVFSYSLIEDPNLIAAVMNKTGSIICELFNRMSQFDVVGGLFYSDDIAYYSGLMCSPAVFRAYLFPWMRKIADLCRERDMPFIYHTDGRLWEVMDDLVAVGINALQPIEPKAFDIREVKQKYGKQLCLVGNVDMDLLTRGTPDEIRTICKGLIQDIGQGGGYCLGSGNTVPNYIPFVNYRAMLEAGWEFGAYC